MEASRARHRWTYLVWRLGEGPSEPLALGPADTLRWQPVAGGPLLDISMAELFGTG
jgi:hypothetical protein